MISESIPPLVTTVELIQDPAAPDLSGLVAVGISVLLLVGVALWLAPRDVRPRPRAGAWELLAQAGVFVSLAVAILAGYPDLERAVAYLVGRTFLTDLAQVYGGAGLIHIPTLLLFATMILAYTVTPVIAGLPIYLADLMAARFLARRHGLELAAVEVAELEE